MMPVDLDDTTNCPLGHRCESCGSEREDLRVETATTDLGVLCLTLCPPCAASDVTPPVAIGTAVRLVHQHCAHLGIDVDQMAAVLDSER
jgi:hypothetical protein